MDRVHEHHAGDVRGKRGGVQAHQQTAEPLADKDQSAGHARDPEEVMQLSDERAPVASAVVGRLVTIAEAGAIVRAGPREARHFRLDERPIDRGITRVTFEHDGRATRAAAVEVQLKAVDADELSRRRKSAPVARRGHRVVDGASCRQ